MTHSTTHRPSQPGPVLAANVLPMIAAAQQRAGLTRADLARASGLQESTVKRIMEGTTAPGWDTLVRLSSAAGLIITIHAPPP